MINLYCKSALHQIKVAVTTIVEIIDKLEESDLQKRPTANKHSIGELLAHRVHFNKKGESSLTVDSPFILI